MAEKKKENREQREREMQTKYVQLQIMKQQLNALAENKQIIDERVNELGNTVDALHKLEDIDRGQEIWSSLGGSVFVMADIKDTEKVFVAIGAGIVARETKERAIEILQERTDEMSKIQREIIEEAGRIATEMNKTERELEKMAQQAAESKE